MFLIYIHIKGTKHALMEKGIDVMLSSKDSIKSRVTNKERRPSEAGVYILTCDKPTCHEIYVGESQHIPTCLGQHKDAIDGNSVSHKYASAKHSGQTGHNIDISNALTPYRSTSRTHRLIIETSLIKLCNTVKDSKASSNVKDMDIIGPIILGAAPVDWKAIGKAQPDLNPAIIPRAYRNFFRFPRQVNLNISDTSSGMNSSTSQEPELTHDHMLRSGTRNVDGLSLYI